MHEVALPWRKGSDEALIGNGHIAANRFVAAGTDAD